MNVEYLAEKPKASPTRGGAIVSHLLKWWAFSLGIKTKEEYEAFVNCKTYPISNEIGKVPGYDELRDLFEKKVVGKSPSILVFGDYDADGITSSSIMKRLLDAVPGNATVEVFIPDRYQHGFGPTDAAVRAATTGRSYDLIIMVDNGSGAPEGAQKLQKQTGADLVIVDHHEPLEGESGALVHINPKLHDFEDPTMLKECSASGLVFLLAAKLKEDLLASLELNLEALGVIAAVGTIADVINLRGVSRSIVGRAMDYTSDDGWAKEIPALHELFYEAQAVFFNDYSVGWKIAPCINAVSRMGRDTDLALQLFEQAPEDPKWVAEQLAAINKERQDAMSEQLELLFREDSPYAKLEAKGANLYVTTMSEGLIGLTAGRLANSHNIPSFVGAIRGDTVKFSGRTPDDRVSLAEVVQEAHKRKLLISGGGHAGACGFSILESKLDAFADMLEEVIPEAKGAKTYQVIGELNWIRDKSFWVNALESFRPYGGPDVKRPYIYAPAATVMTRPNKLRRRDDGEVWALSFYIGDGDNGSVEVTCTDLEAGSLIKRGTVLDAIVQPVVTFKYENNYTNWNLIDFTIKENGK